MGLYINPVEETKEEWLREHGAQLLTIPKEYKSVGKTGTYWVVCLVHNPTFTAAGVCYSDRELEDWKEVDDRRLKMWFLVEEEDLLTVVPDLFHWEACA